PGPISRPPDGYVIVATTRRIADSVESKVGHRPPVLVHLPVRRPGPTSSIPGLREDIAEVLASIRAQPTLLVFGAMHGKKDLWTIARLPELLPAGWSVVVAGDPLVDGRRVFEQLRGAQRTSAVYLLPRALEEAEIDALVVASAAVFAPQRVGEASM